MDIYPNLEPNELKKYGIRYRLDSVTLYIAEMIKLRNKEKESYESVKSKINKLRKGVTVCIISVGTASKHNSDGNDTKE